MLKIFKFDREVYSGAEIRERVDYYRDEADRILKLSDFNSREAMNEFKRLKDEIKAEDNYYCKMNFQTIVGSFVEDNAIVVNKYVALISDIVSKLSGTNIKSRSSWNLGEFSLYITFSDIEELLINNGWYGHYQAANVERDLRTIGSGSQEYTFLSRTHMFLIHPSNKSYNEMLKVWKQTDGNLFDEETLKGYINKKLIDKFK
ncbi:hypothetical protein [Streptococcus alactolyticus]|uniref:hypothetical protein n=1 Tax=Streptococcus alactolyticus TaxID=29389 RepID=UPI003511DD89